MTLPIVDSIAEDYHRDAFGDLSEDAVPKNHFTAPFKVRGKWQWLIGAGLLVWAIIALTSVLLASGAQAHDALPTSAKPNGWSYPFACCSGYDCREVEDVAISERPEGYVINGTGEVLGYRDARVKTSPDGVFHWCSVAGADDGRTICLFVPPRSY